MSRQPRSSDQTIRDSRNLTRKCSEKMYRCRQRILESEGRISDSLTRLEIEHAQNERKRPRSRTSIA